MEEWRDIAGYEKLYKVSNLGRVKSLARERVGSNIYQDAFKRTYSEKILDPVSRGEYLAVTLYKEGKQSRKSIHRLVLLAFVPNPDNLPEADHINRNKHDNCLENLRWASHSTNSLNRDMRLGISNNRFITLSDEGTYRVRIKRTDLYFNKTFSSLEEAVEARDTSLATI